MIKIHSLGFISFLIILFPLSLFAQEAGDKYCSKKLIGYVTNWSANSNVDYSGLTHAFFSFLKPTEDGGLIEYSSEEAMALSLYLKQTKKTGCKRIISLGGGGDEVFPIMANNVKARANFILQVVAFCKQYKFDGIEMDWELMSNEQQKKNYTLLMKEFKVALDQAGLTFVATIGFGNYWCQWIENEALAQADWIQLMIYDQTGTWADSPFGNHASFEHFTEAENYWVGRGFAKDKIVMGLPFYGYKFNSTKGGQGVSYKYSEIIAQFSSCDSTVDQTPGEDYCFFNGQSMIYKKTFYSLENGFAGVMVWEMSQDVTGAKSLHKSILKAFSAYCAN